MNFWVNFTWILDGLHNLQLIIYTTYIYFYIDFLRGNNFLIIYFHGYFFFFLSLLSLGSNFIFFTSFFYKWFTGVTLLETINFAIDFFSFFYWTLCMFCYIFLSFFFFFLVFYFMLLLLSYFFLLKFIIHTNELKKTGIEITFMSIQWAI